MVRRADRDAVVAAVVAASRAKEEVMVVQVPPGAAGGHRTPPSVAREDGVAMARLALPLGLYVREERLEAPAVRLPRTPEGQDRRPEERPDRPPRPERQLHPRPLLPPR